MAGFPEPEVGLVISYSYLWKEEEERGQVEGRKDRPCAIVLAIDNPDPETDGHKQVAVVPITHSLPHDPNVAVEIPPRVKEHLGLDADRSWVILEEVNVFTWPGFDLRPVKRGENRVASTMGCCLRVSLINLLQSSPSSEHTVKSQQRHETSWHPPRRGIRTADLPPEREPRLFPESLKSMSQRKISSGVVHDLPADLRKALASDRSWRGLSTAGNRVSGR